MNYLSKKDVLMIHYLIMKKYGGGEQAGFKDEGLLDSAIHRPQQTLFGEDAYASLFEKAGALFESIARNHAFHNGNKRTAFAVTEVFLKKNGYKIRVNTKENEDFTVKVAQGHVDISEISMWLETHSVSFQ
jgi:death-on-curing protein